MSTEQKKRNDHFLFTEQEWETFNLNVFNTTNYRKLQNRPMYNEYKHFFLKKK